VQSKIVSFINVLRSREVRVSPAETLDAMQVLSVLGYADRQGLRDGLSLALAKTPEEKVIFRQCFDRFFDHSLNEGLGSTNSDNAKTMHFDEADGAADTAQENRNQVEIDFKNELEADSDLAEKLDIPLINMLRQGEQNNLAISIAQAAEKTGLSGIKLFTQKGIYTRKILDEIGEEFIQKQIIELEKRNNPAINQLREYRDTLREQVKDYVEHEYLLHAEGNNKQLMDDILGKAKLSNIEHHYMNRVHDLVRRMAKRLATRHARKRKTYKRGQLNMIKTIRRGVANDGVLFNTYWKSIKKTRPQILAVCDVSGSVAAYAKFLLLFIYSLNDVLPRVRSFAFSSTLGEITDMFSQYPAEKAIEMANWKYGGATDYGTALLDFASLVLDEIDSNTTVIILGDARNNHSDPKLEIMQSVYQRAKKVIWLNPEPRNMWGSGDSDMKRYQSACHFSAECNSLQQLERVVDQLLKDNN
jgi:uncharacterized protein with von Willebrand factor type A (vWA) domain